LPSVFYFGTKEEIISGSLKFSLWLKKNNMSYNEDEEVETGFKVDADEDELEEPKEGIPLEEEFSDEEYDPDNRYH